jgi:hypothetical protein
MKIRCDEPFLALRVYVKMSEIHETGGVWHNIFSEINLDSSIIYVIILTNLIFLASKLGVSTLNIIWSFLHDRDINDMFKIVPKQKYLNFDRRKT